VLSIRKAVLLEHTRLGDIRTHNLWKKNSPHALTSILSRADLDLFEHWAFCWFWRWYFGTK
jgi:uncharacterized protein (DUF2336 family)